MSTLDLDRCARLPEPGDNAAIATHRIEAGTVLRRATGEELRLTHTVLEGHRFVLGPVARGELLLSWGLPFGRALHDLQAGDYLCNAKVLSELATRELDLSLPAEPSFEDDRHRPDLEHVRPGEAPSPVEQPGTFEGYVRGDGRGVGTRNHVIVLALTEAAGPLAEAIAARFEGAPAGTDGVVPVTHTEDGSGTEEHRGMLLRTLAGFLRHPNVGAALVVDGGSPHLDIAGMRAFLAASGGEPAGLPHGWLERSGTFDGDVQRGVELIESWLPDLARSQRSEAPLSALKLALQCGGSDAFSGVSGNALAGRVARELIRHGGAAGLAETDELIGAEDYMLANVRDVETARRFLGAIERFQARAALHGASAEGNPSGGNMLRGLYNITLKSIGAARKKDPAVRLDHVIDYAAPMEEPGFYFMDSPGNDLESIAGQVASGCNAIVFITGNGSITNFPFVPTLKFVTTTPRFEMLAAEMDVNAGRFGDGEPMEELAAETFLQLVRTASGERTRGEEAGHAQVSIWRAWRQTGPGAVEAEEAAPRPSGQPLAIASGHDPLELEWEALQGPSGPAARQVGLVLPTSLCSGQIARLAAERLGAGGTGDGRVTGFASLVHTEGCGSTGAEDAFFAILGGHLRHPSTRRALLLEHGCEKIHNDAMRGQLSRSGVPLDRFGFASVQLDGGLERVCGRIEEWFEGALEEDGELCTVEAGAEHLRLGLMDVAGGAEEAIDERGAMRLAQLAGGVVEAGGTVVVASTSGLWHVPAFCRTLLGADCRPAPSLGHGESFTAAGLHVMDTEGAGRTEVASGLAGAGVDLILALIGTGARAQGSTPIVPVLNLAVAEAPDVDVVLAAEGDHLERAVADVLSRRMQPALAGHTGFQLTRGKLGISL